MKRLNDRRRKRTKNGTAKEMEKLNEGNSRTRKGRPLSSGSKEWKEAAEFELVYFQGNVLLFQERNAWLCNDHMTIGCDWLMGK